MKKINTIMKQILQTSLAVFALGAMFSCSSDNSTIEEPVVKPDETPTENIVTEDTIDGNITVLSKPEYTSSIKLDDNELSLNESVNKFSINLFNKASENEDLVLKFQNNKTGNLTISPLGVVYCLGMEANAVNDEASEKIAQLYGASSLDEFNNYNRKIMQYLPYTDSDCYELTFANSAWLSSEYKFRTSFVYDLNNYYNSDVYNADFSDPYTKVLIDSWCYKKTNGTIEKFPFEVPSYTKCLLLNALYFHSSWAAKFNEDNTTNAWFYGTNGRKEVPMMHQTSIVGKYTHNEKFDAIRLPYSFNNYEMVVVLPCKGTDIKEFSNNFSYEDWVNASSANDKSYDVDFYLPKFKFDQSLMLSDILKILGVPFEEVTMEKAGINEPFISIIGQKAYTEVTEDGTTVAAITGNLMVGSAGGSTPKYENVTMNVNRPFLYFVYNKVTGTILMAGRISNITK
jgi:serpin B